jgi:hypothetical protein
MWRPAAAADRPGKTRFDFNMVRIVNGKLTEHWNSH